MYCSNCGKEINEKNSYCMYCGAKTQGCIEPNKKSNTLNYKLFVLIIAVIVVVCIGVMLGVKLFRDKKVSKNNDYDVADEMKKSTTEVSTVVENEVTEEVIDQNNPQALKENYANIVDDLTQREAKDMPQGEMDLMWALTEPFVNTKICELGGQYLTREFSDYEMSHVLYKLVRYLDWDYVETQVSVGYLEYKKDKDDNIIYEKDNLNKLLNDYLDLGDRTSDCWQGQELFPEKDDTFVLFFMGDGDPWIAFRKIAVMENENYKMVIAPCFYGDNSGVENQYKYTMRVLYEKTKDSSFGVRMVYVDTTLQKPQIESITVSSTLEDDTGNSYAATNMIDGDMTTAWSEGVSGTGVGESITIQLDKRQQVFGILMLGGYCKNSDTYNKNGKILEISVDFGNGEYEDFSVHNLNYDGDELEYYMNYPGMSLADNIAFMKPVITDKIVIYILKAATGEKYEDTCVSELDIY